MTLPRKRLMGPVLKSLGGPQHDPGKEKAAASGRGETFARGYGPTKNRKWESATNTYQSELGRYYAR